MAISLEELKKQREQIKKHLEWLDQKIDELGGHEEDAKEATAPLKLKASAEESVEVEIAETKEETKAIEVTEETNVADAIDTPAIESTGKEPAKEPTAEPAPPHLFEPDPNAPVYKAKTQGELRKAQIGCVFIFIVSIALFLFLLFGLPYLLPDESPEAVEDTVQKTVTTEATEEVVSEAPKQEESSKQEEEKRAY